MIKKKEEGNIFGQMEMYMTGYGKMING